MTASRSTAASKLARPRRPRFRSPGWRSRDVLRAALLVAGVWLSLELLWAARPVFFLAFLGVLFGITLSAGVTWLQRRAGMPRGLGAVLLVAGFYCAIVGIGALAAPKITAQWDELQNQLPDALSQAERWLRERQGGVTELLQPSGAGEGGAGGQGGEAGTKGEPTDIRQTLSQQVGNIGKHFFSVFSSTIAVLGGILLITFVAASRAVDPRTYRRGIMHLVPHRARPKAAEVMDAMGVSLRRWLVAQLIGMLAIGVITTIALLLLDVRAAVALGLIAGILEFIPYFGPILSAVPAIAMGFLDGPEKALWVAVAYLAIQQIEGNVLTPLLMKEGLDLPPVLTILGQSVMAIVFGFMGLLVAMPLLGAIMVPIKLLYVHDVVGDEVAVPGTG
jgi:predicted PurR-regulated permease PerM